MAYRLELMQAGAAGWHDRAMFQADSDCQAIGIALRVAPKHRCTALWQGRRLVMISQGASRPSPWR